MSHGHHQAADPFSKDPSTWCQKIPSIDFDLKVSSADAQTKGIGLKFYQTFSEGIGQKLSKALLAKSTWVTAPPCSDKYATACAFELFQATVAYITALNKIDNTDCSGKLKPGAGNDDSPDDGSGVDFVTFVKALSLLDDLGTVDDDAQGAGAQAST